MLGPLFSSRFKAAEDAIASGRLDEAYELLSAAGSREHPKTRELMDRLAEAYLERVREHERAGRYSDALRDLQRAAESGARPEAVADLRAWLQGVAEREQKADAQQRRQIEAARERIEAGSLEGGQQMLADLNAANTQVHNLEREVELRRQSAERELAEARRALELGQYGSACRRVAEARKANPSAVGLAELEADLVRQILERVRAAATEGRLDTAGDLMGQLGETGGGVFERTECERMLADARSAADAIARSQWAAARECVLRLKIRLPDAAWVVGAAEQLEQVDELITTLRAGPLGFLAAGPTPAIEPAPRPAAVETIAIRPRDVVEAASQRGAAATERQQLLVDGAGSYLLLRQPRVTIGRAGSGEPQADVALMADLSRIHAEIARVEDDYFLFARGETRVNGRTVTQRLLEDGDRIELSRRVRLTFRLPNPRSATAVVDLGGSLRLAGDVRRIVLFDRHLTIGNGHGHHISMSGTRDVVAVVERAGALVAQVAAGGNGGGPAESKNLVEGAAVEVAGIRMVLKRA